MNKLRLFVENFLVYGFGGIISKIIPLVMVPIVTRLMPSTSYYGISDMANTLVSFGSALAVMGMYDAMYRLFFDSENSEYKKEICSTTFMFTFGMSIAVCICMIMARDVVAKTFFGDEKYSYLVYITALATLTGATNGIISAPTRMQNKRKIFLVMNTLTPLISYGVSIPLLLKGYYIIALPLAGLISVFSCEIIFWFLNKEWFGFRKIKISYLKPLLSIAIPLLPNFLIYWVFNSSDKLMITNILGTDATGIYSVGAKLGQASQLIYTAFAGGWQFFAFSTMKEKNQVESNSKIFEYLGIISFACTAFVFAFCHPIYEVLFTGVYVQGYIISPYLFLAPLLQMLFQVACNQFLVIKKTWPNVFILSLGAVVNIVLNQMLIPQIGIEGAAISTLIGYVLTDIVVVIVLVKMKLMRVSLRFIAAVLIFVSYILCWRFITFNYLCFNIVCAIFLCFLYYFMYQKDIRNLISTK